MAFQKTKRGGFTIIELLVVVSIIALLIAILLPSMQQVRNRAKQVQCIANLHGVGEACLVRANDNKNKLTYPKNQTVVYSFVDNAGVTQSISHTYYDPELAWAYLTYPFVYDMRAYGVSMKSQKCPSDMTKYGSNDAMQGTGGGGSGWTVAQHNILVTDPLYYSSYFPNSFVFTYGTCDPPYMANGTEFLDKRLNPDRTFLVLETTQPAPWVDPQGQCYYSSIHSTNYNYGPQRGNWATGQSANLDGSAGSWTWDRCNWTSGPELSPYGNAQTAIDPNLN